MTVARFDGVTKSSMPCALLDLTFLARRLLPGKSGSMPLMASRRGREDRAWHGVYKVHKFQVHKVRQRHSSVCFTNFRDFTNL